MNAETFFIFNEKVEENLTSDIFTILLAIWRRALILCLHVDDIFELWLSWVWVVKLKNVKLDKQV